MSINNEEGVTALRCYCFRTFGCRVTLIGAHGVIDNAIPERALLESTPLKVIDIAARLDCDFNLEHFLQAQMDSLSKEFAELESGTFALKLNDFEELVEAFVAAASPGGGHQVVSLMDYVRVPGPADTGSHGDSNGTTLHTQGQSHQVSCIGPGSDHPSSCDSSFPTSHTTQEERSQIAMSVISQYLSEKRIEEGTEQPGV
jgi:hypothetical protein